jgi:hypothetical protein
MRISPFTAVRFRFGSPEVLRANCSTSLSTQSTFCSLAPQKQPQRYAPNAKILQSHAETMRRIAATWLRRDIDCRLIGADLGSGEALGLVVPPLLLAEADAIVG